MALVCQPANSVILGNAVAQEVPLQSLQNRAHRCTREDIQ